MRLRHRPQSGSYARTVIAQADDPRTTDNAWIETTAVHFHCPPELGDHIHLSPGDDARKFVWLDIDHVGESRYANLYASHRDWLDRVAETFVQHEKARSQELQHYSYPRRFDVDDDYVDWEVDYPEYNPTDYTSEDVRKNRLVKMVGRDGVKDELHEGKLPPHIWADPSSIEMANTEGLSDRTTFEKPIKFDPRNSRPLNPRGRTGLEGRGRLGKWGPNQAVNPIVTRFHPRTNRLQVVVVRRKDTDEWALPSKMVGREEKTALALRHALS